MTYYVSSGTLTLGLLLTAYVAKQYSIWLHKVWLKFSDLIIKIGEF